MTPTITIQQAAVMLNVKDARSVKRFCEKNDVTIYLAGGGKKYLMRMELEYAQHSQLIKSLQIKYKDKWFEIFHAFMESDLMRMMEIRENSKVNVSGKIDRYKIIGGNEKRFLESLTQKTSEL